MKYVKLGRRVLVPRFGTGSYIGAEPDRAAPGNVRYIEGRVVAIPDQEFLRFRREYRRALNEKELVEVDEAAFKASVAAEQEALKTAKEERLKARAEARAKKAPGSPAEAPTEDEDDEAEETTGAADGASQANEGGKKGRRTKETK